MEETNIVSDLRRVSRQLARELGVIGTRHPIAPCTVTEGHLLVELDLEGSLTLGDLKDRLVLDKSTTSRAVAGLVKRGLADEHVDPADLRRKYFSLTAAGRELVDRIHRQADARVREALELLGPDEPAGILAASARYARALQNARHAQDYRIRPLRPGDNVQLAELFRDVRGEHLAVIGGEAPMLERVEQDMYTLYSGPDCSYSVIEKDGRIVGGGGFSRLEAGDEGVCELQRMYFRREARGLGLGYRLLSRCLREAAELGFRACYAETMAGMERANQLYEKAGFRRLDRPLGATGHNFTDAWFYLELDTRRGD